MLLRKVWSKFHQSLLIRPSKGPLIHDCGQRPIWRCIILASWGAAWQIYFWGRGGTSLNLLFDRSLLSAIFKRATWNVIIFFSYYFLASVSRLANPKPTCWVINGFTYPFIPIKFLGCEDCFPVYYMLSNFEIYFTKYMNAPIQVQYLILMINYWWNKKINFLSLIKIH